MAKRKKTIALLCLVVGFGIGTYVCISPAVADWWYEQCVRVHVALISYQMRSLRGFGPGNVSIHIVTIDWCKETWGRAWAVSEETRLEEVMYKALLLIPEDVSLGEIRIAQTGYILAAVSGNDLWIVKDYFKPFSQRASKTLVHELTHVIQFQYLVTAQTYREVDSHDEDVAVMALIEGDACFTANKWDGPPLAQIFIADCVLLASYERIPEPIIRLWFFPYRYGERFVENLFDRGGWEAVNRAYSHPPRSSEQVIHPEKYLSGEVPTHVEGLRFGGDMELKKVDTLGEYFIFVMLSNHLGEADAFAAAEGWAGDTLTLYLGESGYLLAWKIRFDSADDAVEFGQVFTAMLDSLGFRSEGGVWKVRGRYITWEEVDSHTVLILSSDLGRAIEEARPRD